MQIAAKHYHTVRWPGIANRHPAVTVCEAPTRLSHRRMFFVFFCTCSFASTPRERLRATLIQILRKPESNPAWGHRGHRRPALHDVHPALWRVSVLAGDTEPASGCRGRLHGLAG